MPIEPRFIYNGGPACGPWPDSGAPADLIGCPDLGRIAPGAAADLVWLDDALRTQVAWVAGEKVYGHPEGEALR